MGEFAVAAGGLTWLDRLAYDMESASALTDQQAIERAIDAIAIGLLIPVPWEPSRPSVRPKMRCNVAKRDSMSNPGVEARLCRWDAVPAGPAWRPSLSR